MSSFFFFNDTATTEIYTLSLHDALPISRVAGRPDQVHHPLEAEHRVEDVERDHRDVAGAVRGGRGDPGRQRARLDRKSTRLNSSHSQISYAVFCLKKKKTLLTLPRLADA